MEAFDISQKNKFITGGLHGFIFVNFTSIIRN